MVREGRFHPKSVRSNLGEASPSFDPCPVPSLRAMESANVRELCDGFLRRREIPRPNSRVCPSLFMNPKIPRFDFTTIACVVQAVVFSAITAIAQPATPPNAPTRGGASAATALTSPQQEAVGAMNQSLIALS